MYQPYEQRYPPQGQGYSRKRPLEDDYHYGRSPYGREPDRRDPLKLDYLVSYSQFCDMVGLRDRQGSLDSEKRYEAYKETFFKRQNEVHFKMFSSAEWYLLVIYCLLHSAFTLQLSFAVLGSFTT